MGFFDWLAGSPATLKVNDDVVWLSKQAKLAGIFAAVAKRITGNDKPAAVLLVAHFQDCYDELQQAAQARELSSDLVIVTMADNLTSSAALASGLDASATLELVIGERHPHPRHDEPIKQFASSLPCRCCLTHHVSLEDASLKLYAGEWVQGVLKQLGMKDDQPVESPMVARRLAQARQKTASHAVGDLAAGSAEEWMKLNCPELWRHTEK